MFFGFSQRTQPCSAASTAWTPTRTALISLVFFLPAPPFSFLQVENLKKSGFCVALSADRDPTHFRYVLNFLRDSRVEVLTSSVLGVDHAIMAVVPWVTGRVVQVPAEEQSLVRELLAEAEFYQVDGLISLLTQALEDDGSSSHQGNRTDFLSPSSSLVRSSSYPSYWLPFFLFSQSNDRAAVNLCSGRGTYSHLITRYWQCHCSSAAPVERGTKRSTLSTIPSSTTRLYSRPSFTLRVAGAPRQANE